MAMTPSTLAEDANKRNARDLFEDLADHYARERERLPYFRAQIRNVLDMLDGESGRVLDIGCAAGGEIHDLRARSFSVVGVDLAATMVKLAQRRFTADPEVHFSLADAEWLPFADGSMDHVVCLGVFEFLRDYTPAVREIHRVMRPGGLAVFAIPSYVSLYNVTARAARVTMAPVWRAAKRALRGSPPPSLGPAHVDRNLVRPWRFRELLRAEGFEPQFNRYTNFFVYPLDLFPVLDVWVAAALEPLCALPLVRCAASVYMVSARKR
jgi:SAM-dependent methyltransferase